MTSSPPLTTSENQGPPARDPWWRQWLEPAVAGTIITALVIALISVGVAGFQSLKGDMRDMEARLSENIIAVETRLTKAIAASEARQRQDLKDFKAETKENLKDFKVEIKTDLKDFKADLKDFKAEIKADNRALNDKLDRVLESLPTTEN